MISGGCTNCKPKYGSGYCYSCSTSSSVYYTIKSDGTCLLNECFGDKIIAASSECTSQTITSLYKLGDFYYSSNNPQSSTCGTNKLCSCPSYFYTQKIYGKKKIICFSLISSHPSGYIYFNYKTNEFFNNGCPDGYKKMKYNTPSTGITRCSDFCEPNEYYIEYIDTSNNNAIKEYCVSSCSNPGTIYSSYGYEYFINGIKMCLTACPNSLYLKEISSNKICVTQDQCDYYDSGAKKCYSACTLSGKNYHNYDSKECISTCTGEYLYKNGYICYKKEDCNFIDEIDKLCLSSCSITSRQFHNINSKSCISSCTSNYRYYVNGQYTCYSSCSEIPGNYQFEESGSGNHLQCYISQPSVTSCEAYYKKSYGVFKCITKYDCINNKHYRYFIGEECLDNCIGYYQLEITESTPSYIQCFDSLESALSNVNVKFCDTNRKKCWKIFPTTETYFINSQYSSHAGKYELVKECPNFYYEKTDTNIINQPTKWCTDNCKTIATNIHKYYYKGSKKCIDSCADIYKYYYYGRNNECLDSCETEPGYQFSYPITTSPPEPKECLPSCIYNQGNYYDYDSHICLQNCNQGKYLYHKVPTSASQASDYVCYPSCLDIPGGVYIYELSDNSCYEVQPASGCSYYYKKSDGVFKCVTITECSNLNYKYLFGNECKSKCDDNFYKLDITIPITLSDGTTTNNVIFNKCFLNPNDCYNSVDPLYSKIYYNIILKKCWTEYQTGYYIKITDTTKYELVESCDKYYYVNEQDNNNKYCTDVCYKTNPALLDLYFLKDNKKCEASCTSFLKKYYDPDTHECLDTCKGNTVNPFQLQPTSTNDFPLECQRNCPSDSSNYFPFYNHDSNICLSHCGADGSNNKYHKQNGYICYPSCSAIPDGNYIYEYLDSTDNSYICYDDTNSPINPSGDCPYYYLKSDGTKQCQTAKECKDKNYIYLINNECRDRCDEYYKREIHISIDSVVNTFIKCFETTNECFSYDNSNNEPIYYFEKNRRCWKSFPNGYFIKNDSIENENELVEKCEKYYYVDSGKNICTNNCKGKGLYFINGKYKCESEANCINYLKNY